MKMSTRVLLLSLGATSLSAALALPAFADDNTPVTGGTVNCSTARDSAPNKHCLTKQKEGEKVGFDQWAEERGYASKTPAPSGKPRGQDPGRIIFRDDGAVIVFHDGPKGGLGSITAGGFTRNYTTPGNGGSGGGKGRTSSR